MNKNKFSIGLILSCICYLSPVHSFETIKNENSSVINTIIQGHEVTAEGAWCWFADPRALHYKSKDGNINKTYIGYIDIHGNVKAMQYDFNKNVQEEVLIRSYFQPDDHNNPTFLVLPDERIMIFYSRHTDEACFYYRISRKPGDITTLGEEKKIITTHNTTYPSPFLLSDDPEHMYLCWRGIGWHPTIAKLELPDGEDNVDIVWGPYQIVQSTGARPYAKYTSNGKDKILLTYTTGHPDNEKPNFLYFNYINIHTLALEDVKGNQLSTVADGPFAVNKTNEYVEQHPATIVDHPDERDWVWEMATDKQGYPVIAFVRISDDKSRHNYYYGRWTGQEWKKVFLTYAGGHFHQTPTIEKCYSGGIAIDPENSNVIYCSIPVEGEHGIVYELMKYTLADDQVVSVEAVTHNSRLNNIRPYIIPGSADTPLRLTWMYGNYYDWIVSSQRPQGYCTAIHSNFTGFSPATEDHRTDLITIKKYKFNPEKPFDFTVTLSPDTMNYQGNLLKLGKLEYHLDKNTMKPEIRYNGKVHRSTNVLGTSDNWQMEPRSTNGKWYPPQKFTEISLRMEYAEGILRTYINGLLDQSIEL